MASGIRDKVAILGMGCSKFGERWDAEPSDLMAEAFEECIADAGIERSQIDAAWLSTAFDSVNVGPSALPLATAPSPRLHPRHACREHVRERHGGLPRRLLRGRLGRRGLRARARRGEAEGHRLRRPAGPDPRGDRRPFLAERLRPRRLRPARGRLSRRPRHRQGRSQARHGPRLGQESRQRRAAIPRRTCAARSPTSRPSARRWSRSPSACSIAAASATARPAPSSPRPRLP